MPQISPEQWGLKQNKTKQNKINIENIFIHDTRKTDDVANLKYFRCKANSNFLD
jgi:hypothetical protein